MERIEMKNSYTRSEDRWMSSFDPGNLRDILNVKPDLSKVRFASGGFEVGITLHGADQIGRAMGVVNAFDLVRYDVNTREVSLIEKFTKRMIRVNFASGDTLVYDNKTFTWKRHGSARGLFVENEGSKWWVSGDTYMRVRGQKMTLLSEYGGIWHGMSKRFLFVDGLPDQVWNLVENFIPNKYHIAAQWLMGGAVTPVFNGGLTKRQFGIIAEETLRRQTWKDYGFNFKDFPFPLAGSSLKALLK